MLNNLYVVYLLIAWLRICLFHFYESFDVLMSLLRVVGRRGEGVGREGVGRKISGEGSGEAVGRKCGEEGR